MLEFDSLYDDGWQWKSSSTFLVLLSHLGRCWIHTGGFVSVSFGDSWMVILYELSFRLRTPSRNLTCNVN